MPEHLLLPDPRPVPSRRAGGAGGGAPNRQRGPHGSHLRDQLAVTVRAPRRLDQGVDPALVFKIKARSRPEDSAFEGRGLQVLGETVDYTYFVLAEDQGTQLDAAIQRYVRTGELRSFFNLIDDFEPYGPEDRMGPGLEDLVGGYDGVRTLDVTIWPSGSFDQAQARTRTVEGVLARSDGRLLLRSVTARRTYLRVAVSADGLADLLNTSVVEIVRTPPVPFLDFREWRDIGPVDLSHTRRESVVVGVLDDSPESGHPLLDGLILSDDSLAPDGYQWQQRGSHGTEVVGRVLYPDLHNELRDLSPLTAVGAVRVVRILEPDPNRDAGAPRFATYAPPHELVSAGIRHLHERFGVRIFNLSVGYAEPYNDLHLGALTEAIDDLIRELDIVVVVPSGNAGIDLHARTPSGHHIVDDKPEYFFTADHRLSEPGPAALAVTVGSLALSEAPAEMPNRIGWQAAAATDEASPFTRTGPGLGTALKRTNKPDMTHYGGNTVVNDSGGAVHNDPGASLITTSTRLGDGRLFAAVNGTSFASPAVARVAADIAHAYPDASANLIRALLATSAAPPGPAASITEHHRRARVYGLGRPDGDRALNSGATRVTMTYDGALPVDTVQIHPIPIPEIFRRGSGGSRAITIALAFDPPVRRQRREYLAAAMKVDVYRNIDPDQLVDMLQKQDPDDPTDLINDSRRLDLQPGSNSFTNSTLHMRRWTRTRTFIDDEETFYLVVTHKAQTWARNEPSYQEQAYALAVTLEDQNLVQADLRQILTQQVRVPARLRVRA
ncbi:S8 family peptidase [Nocardioides sp.]|uniref:S8 family peptidase n=1 Tax=Nocardioides sp. TaxID=35761 RepID=UPI0026344957|nr:S8 family peptidase [Nocardioides sp.]